MLSAQLADKEDVIGRLLAIEQLSTRHDKEALAKLKQALNDDAFYGVRIEASKALRADHSDEALEALLTSTKQSDARVRLQVMVDIGGFYRDTAFGAARRAVDAEKNPAIIATEIRDLAGYEKNEVRPLLLKYLDSQSFMNELADAAIGAIRLQDDPAYVSPLLETLGKREPDFTSGAFARGLGTLAYLARNEEKKQTVREFLVRYVNHKKRAIRLASLSALGTLGDSEAIVVLNKFATAAKDSPERSTAERAVPELRATRKPVDDFKNLRSEVLELQKSNRELRKELEDLKKKLEARPALAPESQSKKKKSATMPPKHPV